MTEFETIFARLRAILQKYDGALTVTADEPAHYCLSVDYHPRFKKGYPAGWVKVSKSYVSYHFMPVYMFPKLRDGMSKELKARMQGKSCFNFKTADEALFKELAELTAKGFAMSREAGFGNSGASS